MFLSMLTTSSSPVLFPKGLPHCSTLCTKFAIKDLDLLHFFLGMEATTTPARLILSQQPYILDLLHKSNMTNTKPVKTPMSTAHALSLLSGDPLTEPISYRSLIGALQYPSPVLISHLLLPILISPLWYLKFTISYGLLPAASLLPFSKPSQMPTRLAVLMNENLQAVSVFFSAPISFHGPPTNNGQSPAPVLNQNIAPLLPSPQNSFGFNLYFMTLVFIFLHHLPYGVTTSGSPTSPPTPPSMLGPNT
jgi:hypothetical protein